MHTLLGVVIYARTLLAYEGLTVLIILSFVLARLAPPINHSPSAIISARPCLASFTQNHPFSTPSRWTGLERLPFSA